MNGQLCQHKDCERTDATPVEFMLYRRGELVDERTYYFCRGHREALHALETTPTLPPAEWLEGDDPQVHRPCIGRSRQGQETRPEEPSSARRPLRLG